MNADDGSPSRWLRAAGITAAVVMLGALGACKATTNGGPSTTPSPTTTAATTTAATARVDVYLHSGNNETCDEVVAVGRTVEGPPTLLAAMRALAQGPTADETSRGLGGWFTQATAAVVKTAEIRDGVATVDFEDLRQRIPNASSSCGSAMLLAQLDRTARQFPSVTATRYSIDGSPDDFYEWLQLAVPGS